ncbi:hypothetical protein [Alicyclobacillus tolerans]|uniref:VIT1/CCC1 family predicted Fe2+/Mn2+ transporter n=2 Tax=Alicyclobacillus tolerans TaxID=90970 RepID=A0ABT9M088_9BACL|nr:MULTISPECIES: hypothetical protein [Alicyclobacillus]MDP9729786.1 VIT1/CCC1 family predicted Fe2+/Mn2+ transporter [Alicyclobacillus tengchongensis]SHK35503.1 hypothetical protein SAMN05443507_11290 [Alicyclobacillus montanus]
MQEPNKKTAKSRQAEGQRSQVVDLRTFRQKRRLTSWRESYLKLPFVLTLLAYLCCAISAICSIATFFVLPHAERWVILAIFFASIGFIPAFWLSFIHTARSSSRSFAVLALCMLLGYIVSLVQAHQL